MSENLELVAAPTCTCACVDEAPVLDVRAIPHSIRHSAVFGAFDAIPVGGSLVVIAPHAPMPLLAQLADRAPVEWTFLTEGPDEWRVQITRRGF